ncbi:hypothetical protein RE6C_00216 [Rhodopirellula europaea 6C]|uniref:Uncharacterized protein n=1 Tax=Rhodopirellula europaea 6C TaxID=1263867 RepID=M2BBR7_9BACT|nr:hypothetical protein RE6C_00216 [Rhodopirellula europaea 6C]
MLSAIIREAAVGVGWMVQRNDSIQSEWMAMRMQGVESSGDSANSQT